MRLGNRARIYDKDKPKPSVGKFRNVALSNIIATDCSSIGCSITGLPGHPTENVQISNVNLGFDGGGTNQDAARKIPENPTKYPESTMFGTLPAYGFYCRHVKNLKFQDIRLATSAPDYRHAMAFDDVQNAAIDALDAPFAQNAQNVIPNAQNVIPSAAEESIKTTPQSGSTTQAATAPNAAALIRIIDSANIIIRNCQTKSQTQLFLDLSGPKTKDILLVANDLSKTKQPYRKADNVPDSALILTANRLPKK